MKTTEKWDNRKELLQTQSTLNETLTEIKGFQSHMVQTLQQLRQEQQDKEEFMKKIQKPTEGKR